MAYRDDVEALEHRQAHLAEELERLDDALGRARALESARDALARELADVRSLLRARLPIIERARPASPCTAVWELMEGDDCVRRCQACGKRIFNVSGLSRSEAARLLGVHEAGAKLHRREDGTFIDGDCPLGSRLRQRSRTVVGGGTAALIGVGLVAMATTPPPRPMKVDPNAVDGAAAYTAIDLDDEVDVALEPREVPEARGGEDRETRRRETRARDK
jgi:hypothetical protein